MIRKLIFDLVGFIGPCTYDDIFICQSLNNRKTKLVIFMGRSYYMGSDYMDYRTDVELLGLYERLRLLAYRKLNGNETSWFNVTFVDEGGALSTYAFPGKSPEDAVQTAKAFALSPKERLTVDNSIRQSDGKRVTAIEKPEEVFGQMFPMSEENLAGIFSGMPQKDRYHSNAELFDLVCMCEDQESFVNELTFEEGMWFMEATGYKPEKKSF